MTERKLLSARAASAGLRLGPVEVDELLPAWRRYLELLEELEEALPGDTIGGA